MNQNNLYVSTGTDIFVYTYDNTYAYDTTEDYWCFMIESYQYLRTNLFSIQGLPKYVSNKIILIQFKQRKIFDWACRCTMVVT